MSDKKEIYKKEIYKRLLYQQEQAKGLYDSISSDVKAFEKLNPNIVIDNLNESKYLESFINKVIVIKETNSICIFILATLSFKGEYVDFFRSGRIIRITNNKEVSILHEDIKAIMVSIKNCKDNVVLWNSLDDDTKELVYSSINPSLQLHQLLTENIGEDY